MPTYLCYDLKGIQEFIFAIPRLRYVIGGSALIDRFDREFAPSHHGPTLQYVFSGGGKGCYRCADEASADTLQAELRREAHRIGLSIAFGRNNTYSLAVEQIDAVYPCLPDPQSLDGHPCAVSGAWPVASSSAISEIANRRCYDRGKLPMRRIDDELIAAIYMPKGFEGKDAAFFHNVNAETGNGEDVDAAEDKLAGRAGAAALGNRNRWAVICMDGNSMGTQIAAASRSLTDEGLIEWIKNMSAAVNDCCRSACISAMHEVVIDWVASAGIAEIMSHCCLPDGTVVLPIRPLVLGGDDMIVLCHSAHAFTFVEEVSRAFTDKSRASEYGPLWRGTGGELSISAGMLFCSTSMPLAAAVSYAEQLLANAKQHGQMLTESDRATPACVDWEVVTESVIDTPSARRQRNLQFKDRDIDQVVRVTQKPYQMSQLETLRRSRSAMAYRNLPRGITHKLREILVQPYWDRRLSVASIGKQQPALAVDVDEGNDLANPTGRWTLTNGVRSIDVLDIVEMIEEGLRLERPTVMAGS